MEWLVALQVFEYIPSESIIIRRCSLLSSLTERLLGFSFSLAVVSAGAGAFSPSEPSQISIARTSLRHMVFFLWPVRDTANTYFYVFLAHSAELRRVSMARLS